MRCRLGAFPLIVAIASSAPAVAQSTPDPAVNPGPAPGRNISATGRTMPPANPNATAMKPSVAEEMAKAQKAADARNKAWDSKMRKTMSSICSGC